MVPTESMRRNSASEAPSPWPPWCGSPARRTRVRSPLMAGDIVRAAFTPS